MIVSEQIKVLCVRSKISVAELARRIGKTPQAFNAKMKRNTFSVHELEAIAKAVNAEFSWKFTLANGNTIESV